MNILKMLKSIKKPKIEKEYYWKTFNLLIMLLFMFYLSNELVSPILSPRISEIKITPLYIWGMEPTDPNKEIEYYTIFEVNYDIEMPFFLFDEKINLRMPGRQSYNNVDLITSLQEKNPYYEINLPDEDISGIFVTYQKLNGEVPIIIKASKREIKTIQARFIVREKMRFHPSSIERSNPYWWTLTSISPIDSIGTEVSFSQMSLIGFGLDQKGNYYRFYDMIVKSSTDLEIKGLRRGVTEDPVFCSDGIELTKEFDKYISIDLKAKEVKHILAVSKVPETKRILENEFVFNFTSEDECYGQWLKYKELTGKT